MKLLVGLGNPGKKYDRNRHNIGFMAIEEIARVHQFAPWRSRFKGQFSEGLIEGEKCLLLKPQTYMNLSGEAVREAVQFYKIDPEDVIVFHDEIDIHAAKVKVKSGGGNAGHNGLKSISQHVSNDYQRVRLGVGRPADKSQVANFVLKDFAKADEAWLSEALSTIGRHVGLLVKERNSDFIKQFSDDLQEFTTSSSKAETKPRQQGGSARSKATSDDKSDRNNEPGEQSASRDKTKQVSTETPKSALEAALNKWLKKGD